MKKWVKVVGIIQLVIVVIYVIYQWDSTPEKREFDEIDKMLIEGIQKDTPETTRETPQSLSNKECINKTINNHKVIWNIECNDRGLGDDCNLPDNYTKKHIESIKKSIDDCYD